MGGKEDPLEVSERYPAWFERVAKAAGRQWAEQLRTELIDSNRRLDGTWPGTVTEARAIASAWLSAGKCPVAALQSAQLDRFSRLINAQARKWWFERTVREKTTAR